MGRLLFTEPYVKHYSPKERGIKHKKIGVVGVLIGLFLSVVVVVAVTVHYCGPKDPMVPMDANTTTHSMQPTPTPFKTTVKTKVNRTHNVTTIIKSIRVTVMATPVAVAVATPTPINYTNMTNKF